MAGGANHRRRPLLSTAGRRPRFAPNRCFTSPGKSLIPLDPSRWIAPPVSPSRIPPLPRWFFARGRILPPFATTAGRSAPSVWATPASTLPPGAKEVGAVARPIPFQPTAQPSVPSRSTSAPPGATAARPASVSMPSGPVSPPGGFTLNGTWTVSGNYAATALTLTSAFAAPGTGSPPPQAHRPQCPRQPAPPLPVPAAP